MNFSASLAHTGPTALPLPLVEAQFLCFQKTAVMDLKKTARSVLSGILAFVSVRTPSKKIWPKRETLRVQCRLNSDASLYRGLAELEQKGYVSREEQLHHARNGRFHVSRIGLTEKAINLLNLGNKKLIHNLPSCKMGDGHIRNLVKSTTSKEESPQEEISENTNRKGLKLTFQEIDPETKLPKPLVKLMTLGLSPKTICWLMGEAKQHQKRLEDVMNYAWGYLEPIATKGSSNIKAYLRALIEKKQDFTFQLQQIHAKEREKENNITRKMEIKNIVDNKQGCYLLNKQNQPIGIVEGESIRLFASSRTGFIERVMPIFQVKEINKLIITVHSMNSAPR